MAARRLAPGLAAVRRRQRSAGCPRALFESEMFGHVKGAFTDAKTDRMGRFELADGGTLFLDEIANIGPGQQGRLLRVLQTGDLERVGSSQTRQVDARVLSATNADLGGEVAAGRFREDLLYRLNTIEIRLPPLRERREDIATPGPPLPAPTCGALSQAGRRDRIDCAGGAPALLSWPGNVRELDHAVERAVLLSDSPRLTLADFNLGAAAGAAPRLEDLTLEEVERLLIQKSMARANGNVSEAAKSLGLSRSALYRRLERHRL